MINTLVAKGKAFIEKGRKIKSRGIALTHKDQGYSANLRPVSLLTKADADPSKMTMEMLKSLEQVSLTISMEEFLRRFFDLWSSDAELLTKILGYETEFEANAAANADDMDAWEQDWNQRHQAYLDDKVSGIQLLKAAKDGTDITDVVDRFAIFNIRKTFEEGAALQGLVFEGGEKPAPAEQKPSPETVDKVDTAETVTETKAPSVEQVITKTKENTVTAPATTETDIEKGNATVDAVKFAELEKKFAEQAAEITAAKEILKAHEGARKATLVAKASGMSFIAEDQRDAVVTLLMKSADESSLVLSLLEKAQAALVAKDTELEEVKKSFADGKEKGADGELNKAATDEQDPQEKLNAIIKAHAEQLKTSA